MSQNYYPDKKIDINISSETKQLYKRKAIRRRTPRTLISPYTQKSSRRDVSLPRRTHRYYAQSYNPTGPRADTREMHNAVVGSTRTRGAPAISAHCPRAKGKQPTYVCPALQSRVPSSAWCNEKQTDTKEACRVHSILSLSPRASLKEGRLHLHIYFMICMH